MTPEERVKQLEESRQRVQETVWAGLQEKMEKQKRLDTRVMETIYNKIERYDTKLYRIHLVLSGRLGKQASDCELMVYCTALCGIDKDAAWAFMKTHVFRDNFVLLEEECCKLFNATSREKGFKEQFIKHKARQTVSCSKPHKRKTVVGQSNASRQMEEALERIQDAVIAGRMNEHIMDTIYDRLSNDYDELLIPLRAKWAKHPLRHPITDVELMCLCAAKCGIEKELAWEYIKTHEFYGNFEQLEGSCSQILDETPYEEGFREKLLKNK